MINRAAPKTTLPSLPSAEVLPQRLKVFSLVNETPRRERVPKASSSLAMHTHAPAPLATPAKAEPTQHRRVLALQEGWCRRR